jgi:hypothetical protein
MSLYTADAPDYKGNQIATALWKRQDNQAAWFSVDGSLRPQVPD